MLAEWNRVSAQWFLPRYFGQRKIIKELRTYALRPVKAGSRQPSAPSGHPVIGKNWNFRQIRRQATFCSEDSGETKNGKRSIRLSCRNVFPPFPVAKLFERCGKTSRIKQNLALQLTEGIRTFKRYSFPLPQ